MTPKAADLSRSRKRQFTLVSSDKVCTNSYWDGGTKSEYTVFNIDTGRSFTPPVGAYPWTVKNDYVLQPGDVVMETGMSCGRPATPLFRCLPADVARALIWLGVDAEPVAEVKAENPLAR